MNNLARIPSLPAEALEPVTDPAPRTRCICMAYGIPFPSVRQMDVLGRHLVSLPPRDAVAMDDVFRALGSEG